MHTKLIIMKHITNRYVFYVYLFTKHYLIYYNNSKQFEIGGIMNKVEIKNLSLKKDDILIYDKLNLSIVGNSYTTIIGPSSSGKTILFKTIIKGNKKIKINGNIHYVVTNPDKLILGKTVSSQIKFFMEMNNYTKRVISTRFKNIVSFFNLESILDKDPYKLSLGEKQLVVLCSVMVLDLDILILDNALCRMNKSMKEKVLKYFTKLKKKKVTIINFTSDVSEIIGSDYTILVDKKLVFNKKTKEVIKDNKLFEDNNLRLPFLLDITNKLKYYDLIDEEVSGIDELVDKLWK